MNVFKTWLLAIVCLASGITVIALIPYLMAICLGLLAFILIKMATVDIDKDEPPE
jgi:hypothetical protein